MPASKMHADQIDVDEVLARRLLADQFPHWAELPLKRVDSAGTINAIYRLGEDMSLRLPFIHWGLGEADKDEYWLPLLAPLLPLTIPALLARGEPGQDYPFPWSVHRWLRGRPATLEGLADPGGTAEDLAQFITTLWRIDPADRPHLGTVAPLSARDADARRAIKDLDGLIDTAAVTAAWDAALQAPPWNRRPVLVHSDLLPGNLLTADDRLRAVIDFGALGTGDPASDTLPAWSLFSGEARQTFRDCLRIDDATWSRGRGYALSKALAALPYYQETNPGFAALARHMIDAVLSDDSRRS